MNDIVPSPQAITDHSAKKKTNYVNLSDLVKEIRISPIGINAKNAEFIYKCLANEFGKNEAISIMGTDAVQDIKHVIDTYVPYESAENLETIMYYAKSVGLRGQKPSDDQFWTIDKDGDMKFTQFDLIHWLENHGFRTFMQGRNIAFLQIRNAKIIKEVSIDNIISYVGRFLSKKLDIGLREKFINKKDDYFAERKLKNIKETIVHKNKDTANLCRLFFQNGFVEITPDSDNIILKDIFNLDGFVWESQIIQRHLLPKPKDEDIQNCDFARFLSLAMDQDAERISCATSAFCYLIHNYKSDSTTKAIVATDKAIGALNNESEGRTGKGLMFNRALRELVTTVVMEAPEQPTQFPYERVNEDTRCIVYDELPQNFPLRKFFSRLTTDLVINKKNRPEITIPYKDSPKFVICTNFPIKGDTGSTFDRLSLVEFGNYFSVDRKPKDVFGREFFGPEWDAHEWNCFYWLVIGWMQEYLKTGLKQVVSETNPYKRLVAQSNKDFADFITTQELPVSFSKNSLREEYIKYIGFDGKEVDPDDFGKWLDSFVAIYKSVEYNKSGRVFMLIRQINNKTNDVTH
jgi:hypothetical protein